MSLALLTLCLLSVRPAHAQGYGPSPGWDITYSQAGSDAFTGNGSASGSPYTWGSLNDQYLMGGFAVVAYADSSATITGGGSITAILTWNDHGTGQAPPPKIFLAVSASASFGGGDSGTADDGLKDPLVGNVSQGTHIKGPFDTSGGTVTFSLPMSCTCLVSVPVGGNTAFLWVKHSMTVAITNRDVTISASVDTTSSKQLDLNTPTDANGDLNFVPAPHVRTPDGTMSGDVGLPITALGSGPEAFTNITYHANLIGSWQTPGSYNWFSSLKQQGDSGSLYPPDFTNTYLDPWWIDSGTPGVPPTVALGEADPGKNPDHIHITCTDGGDGAVATADYYMTLHPTIEKNYPDHVNSDFINPRQVSENLISTGPDDQLGGGRAVQIDYSLSSSALGPIDQLIAGILGINVTFSIEKDFQTISNVSTTHVPAGWYTYIVEYDHYYDHFGKADTWGMTGYTGTSPYTIREVPSNEADRFGLKMAPPQQVGPGH